MDNKETPAQLLNKMVILHNNLSEFLVKFAQSTTSYANYTPVNWQNEDGVSETINIPSLGYINTQLINYGKQLEALITANNDEITLKFADGSVKNFEMQKISTLVDSLEQIKDSSFAVPSEFRVKNNWFFESFLNPLLFVTVNVSPFITDNNVSRFAVRRVMLNTASDVEDAYFDDNIKGRNDLSYGTLISSLDNNGIDYVEDDNIVDMPVAINRYRGNFTIVKETEETIVVDGVSVKRRYYKLDKLFYTDIINVQEGTKFLVDGDILLTGNDTEYKVVSIDKSTNMVLLEKVFGNQPIAVGVDVLKIKPVPYRIPELQINVGYDEREVIFVKPIANGLDMTTDKWSKGFALFTNELNITLSDNNTVDLENYYKNFITDFGMMMLSFAKEKQIPSLLALQPSTPILSADNFKVIKVNAHLKEDKSLDDLKKKVGTKEKIENEIEEVNKTINTLKGKFNDSVTINEQERLKIKKDIDMNVNKKSNILNQLSTTIKEITLSLKTTPAFAVKPKYRVRGFWEIPSAKETVHGDQEIIQFIYSYRYISKKGNATNVDQLSYFDQDGVEKIGFFSNWQERISKIRKKEYNEDTGLYVWSDEETQNPDAININQVDIPITKGESVEVRTKSISEAGYPINPAESDWSDPIVVSFPDDLEATEEDEVIAQRLMIDEALVKFQEELNSRGLDIHLFNSITTGDKYYSHKAEDIASGSFTTEGKIIDLYTRLNEIDSKLEALQSAIERDKGVLKVTLVDELGNVIDVQNGNSVSLFAGYYKDIIKDQSVYNNGEIVTKTYVLSLENTSQTALELASRLPGGIDEMVMVSSSSGTDDYDVNRKYDKIPIMVVTQGDAEPGEFKQLAPFQSAQVRSQFIYNRYKDYGLSNNLYMDYPSVDPSYVYTGRAVGSTTHIPYNGGNFLPFDPTFDNGGNWKNHAQVWDGTVSSGSPGVPGGGGVISEFCIHKEHPYLEDLPGGYSTGVPGNLKDLFMPDGGTAQGYYHFAHGLHFETIYSEKSNPFGANYYQQTIYHLPQENSPANDDDYPVKMGFHVNDEYLVGKYTCGAYLFMAPSKYEDISIIGNHPRIAKRVVEYKRENAINIPIIFQFRCSDKLGYVGGYRHAPSLSNVVYTKKIGIDIYEKDNTKITVAEYGDVFSFDIEVSCKYTKETPIMTPVNIPATGALSVIAYSFE